MAYQFLVDTYRTETEKVLSVWAMFEDDDLSIRLHASDTRGRNLLEQMAHQSISEHFWFSTMLGIHVTDKPLPGIETRLKFMSLYHRNAVIRLDELAQKPPQWWEEEVNFFQLRRSRAWIVVRRIAHTGEAGAIIVELDENGPKARWGGSPELARTPLATPGMRTSHS